MSTADRMPVILKELELKRLVINKEKVWGFFDRARQGPHEKSSAGVLYIFSKSHTIKLKAGLGTGTNNFAEFMALGLLIKCALDNNVTVKQMQVYVDSSLMIR